MPELIISTFTGTQFRIEPSGQTQETRTTEIRERVEITEDQAALGIAALKVLWAEGKL